MRWLLLIWLLFPFAAHAEGPVRLDVAASAIAVAHRRAGSGKSVARLGKAEISAMARGT